MKLNTAPINDTSLHHLNKNSNFNTNITTLPGSPDAKADLVPVDVVVNAMLAGVACLHGQDRFLILHAAPGDVNPVRWGVVAETTQAWFKRNPPPKGVQGAQPNAFRLANAFEFQLLYAPPLSTAFAN